MTTSRKNWCTAPRCGMEGGWGQEWRRQDGVGAPGILPHSHPHTGRELPACPQPELTHPLPRLLSATSLCLCSPSGIT